MRNKVACLPLAAALLLAACSGPTVYHREQKVAYSPGEASYAAGAGALLVETEGRFGTTGPQGPALAAALADSLDANGPAWLNADYTADPAAEVNRRYRLRWHFNRIYTYQSSLCAPSVTPADMVAPSPAAAPPKERVTAAFCLGKKPLSIVSAEPEPGTEVGTPAFDRMVRQVAHMLLPPRSPLMKDNDDDCRIMAC